MSTPAPAPRSFARRWSRRIGLGAVLLAVATAALLFWLLETTTGRDTLLGRVLGLLPPDSLSWQRAEGTVSGPLELFGVRYAQDGVVFTAERLLLDPDVLPVLGRRLQLDRLEVDGAVLVLPAAANEPFALPTWPEVLPRLPMPLRMRSERLDVDGLRIERDGKTLVDMRTLDVTALQLVGDGFETGTLSLDSNLGRLTLKGDYRPDRNFRTALDATWSRDATETTPAANLQLSAKGDLDDMALELAGRAPQPLSLTLSLRGSSQAPDWSLRTQSEGFDPALSGAGASEPLAWRLDASGRGGEATLQGEASQGELRIVIEPSRLVLASQMLRAEPLRLQLPQGPLELNGKLLVDGDHAAFDATARSPGLRLEPATGEPGATPVTARGELHAAGTFDHWSLAGEARFERAGEQARLALEGIGDGGQLALRTLRADTPTGSLDGGGRLRWSPAPGFELDAALAGFDPGYFLPDYPGALSGRLVANGDRREDGQWRGHAQMADLSGQLRDRPVSGRLLADWNGDRGTGEAELRIGRSVVGARGGFGAVYDLQARFAPLDLSDLMADASGVLDGSLHLQGPAAALDYAAELQGVNLAWDGQHIDRLRLSGTLPARGDAGAFELGVEGVAVAGIAVERVDARGNGSLAALRLQAAASGEPGDLSLAGEIARNGAEWRGRLDQLRLAIEQAPVLNLEDPAPFRWGPSLHQLDRGCLLAETVGGRLCLAAQTNAVTIEGEALPLALAQPWLSPDEALPLDVHGTLDLRADLQRGRNGAWRGDGRLASARGALRLDEDAERELFGYTDLQLQWRLDGDRLDGDLSAGLAGDGEVQARFATGLAGAAPMDAELRLDVRDLTWLELFSEDLAGPAGHLQGRLQIAGTRADPAFSGQARLRQFAAELPALGVKLRDGEAELIGTPDGALRVDGQLTSGEGRLRLDGSLNFRDDTAPLQLVLVGQDVTLASTPELYVIAHPDLTLRWLDDLLEVRGTLVVPEARVDLEALDSSVSVSPDVVVVDPLDGPRERATPLDLDFAVTLGEDVKLKGFGLDGAMTGRLALRESPGRRATASGNLEVTGKYRAYGQALTIERARLGFAESPYDNPTLDIRAEREFDEVTVGVQVRGTARRPETTVVSSPAMETSEALSWLVFGRPLSTTTSNDTEQPSATALALGAGGNLDAQQLGAQLGLDEAGVTDSRNLGGATFTIGKYVSPRLFLSYGVSLIGTGQVVTLKYLLTRGFDISIEQGNESAASLNWRRER